jgi:hypothetical protein
VVVRKENLKQQGLEPHPYQKDIPGLPGIDAANSREILDWDLSAAKTRPKMAVEYNIQGLPPMGLHRELDS